MNEMKEINVLKRDGSFQSYDQDKVFNAVEKARIEVGNTDERLGTKVVEEIGETLSNEQEISFELVHDRVEVALMKYAPEVAKAYILYRDKRNREREEKWEMSELQFSIWDRKYKFEENVLNIVETFSDWLDRIANGNKNLRKIMLDREFLFGGRILANRDLNKYGRKVTYSNCYVLPSPEDNLESIFDTARDMARTYSFGGGVGISLRKLRPRGFKVHNNAKDTSGAVSFMPIYSLTTETIGQNGRRKIA